MDENRPNNNNTTTTFSIPRASFTAFRLTYASSESISHYAKVLLLGRLPDIWSKDSGPGFLSATSHFAKNTVRSKFRSATKTISSSIRSASNLKVDEDYGHVETEEGGFNIFSETNKRGYGRIAVETLREDLNGYNDSATDVSERTKIARSSVEKNANDGSTINSKKKRTKNVKITTVPRGKLPVLPMKDSTTDNQLNPRQSVVRLMPSDSESMSESILFSRVNDVTGHSQASYDSHLNVTNVTSDESMARRSLLDNYFVNMDLNTPVRKYFNTKASIRTTSSMGSVDSVQEKLRNEPPPDLRVINMYSKESFPRLKENEGAAPSIRSSIKSSRRIRLSAPEPVGLVADDFVLAEREHSRFVRKLRHFATTSKGRAKKSSNDLRSRIYNAVLQKYSVGEVLRIEKMLIMTKILTSNATRFTEDDPCSNRTYENWKEHYVVLRKTDNKIEPLALQFYDIHSVTHDTKSVPEVNFRLSKDVNAQFYSELDKSISISVPQKGEIFGYILKCHDQLSAFRWLHFIKQALGDVMEPYFRVFLPELNVSIRIKVPESILAKSLEPSSNMEISQLEHGYSVEYSPLITYIKECIRTILDNQSNEVLEFLNHTNWFCFRRYDRLEWALNNSEIFFIQNQLLSGQHFLEFRRIGNSSVVSSSATGTIHEEPIPIEGFLSRLSNTSGKSKSLLRTFYKVSYFYTCDSILFFTKYYRAIPPTRDPKSSAGLEDDQSEIYEHSPYPVNKDGHISWLNKDSFHHHDELALSELERRAQQVVKAEAIIDLCLVKEIRAVPHTQLTKTQKVLLCYFWYSDTSLADDKNIIESAFEIEMMNGSVVKLQAPNRFIRDQWVSKLSAIAQYWSLRQQSDLRRLLLVRNSNQNVLNIPEFVDSNFNFELNNLEYQHSVADPRIHSIESVAMKKCILMSGYLYQKSKKHANFNKFFVILCPGFIILYSLFKRSKATGVWKDNSLFEHYLTIPISTCYIYSGTSTELDLLNRQKDVDPRSPGRHSLPRLYADGWKSSDEEAMRCFTLWFGRKRKITGREKAISSYDSSFKTDVSLRNSTQKNPGLTKLIGKLGFTGKSIVFMTRSRQEREIWTGKILCEIDRFAKSH